MLLNNAQTWINCFLDTFIKHNGQIQAFKENYVDFVDKLDFYVKFIDFLKTKEDMVFGHSESNLIILMNSVNSKIFLELGRCLEENVF